MTLSLPSNIGSRPTMGEGFRGSHDRMRSSSHPVNSRSERAPTPSA